MRFLFVMLFMTGPMALAQSEQPTLQELMKAVGDEMKVIQLQLDKPETNSDSQARALKMRKLFIVALSLEPNKVREAPEAERPGLIRAYDRFLGRILVASSDLEDHFSKNDNEKAKASLAEMNLIRREAHRLLAPN